MSTPSPELQELVAAYVSGIAGHGQIEQLTRLLQADEAARDYFLQCADLHGAMTTDESLRIPGGETVRIVSTPAATRHLPRSGRPPARSRTITALAACAAGLVAVTALVLNRDRPADTDTSATDPPTSVAVLSDTTNAVWRSHSFVPRDVGEAIACVTTELVSGRAEFQFDSGARVAIAGPAVLEFLSGNHARLQRGQLTAFVPDSARGFTIDFEGAKLVDLGTEFAINSDGGNTAEVHVYDGEVVVQNNYPRSKPLTLRTNDTKRLKTRQGTVEDALFESERFLRLHREVRAPMTGGDVRYLNRPPRSVLQGSFEHNQYILLFRERADLTLDREVMVSATAPGSYRTRRAPDDPPGTAVAVPVDQPDQEALDALPVGTRLSSYFVHFDPAGGGGKGVHRQGSIRFQQPVIGIIITTRHLVATDPVLGHAGSSYETTDFAIARNGLEPDDRVTLDPDGHTVNLQLGAGTSVDHLRILVEVAPPH